MLKKRAKFNPVISKVKLNLEQAVLLCCDRSVRKPAVSGDLQCINDIVICGSLTGATIS